MRRIIYENRASLFIIKSRASLWIVDRGAMREAKEEKIAERIDDRWGTRSSHYKFYEFEKGNNDYWLGKRSGKFTGDVSCLPRRRCHDKFRAHEKSNPYHWKIEVTIEKKKKEEEKAENFLIYVFARILLPLIFVLFSREFLSLINAPSIIGIILIIS